MAWEPHGTQARNLARTHASGWSAWLTTSSRSSSSLWHCWCSRVTPVKSGSRDCALGRRDFDSTARSQDLGASRASVCGLVPRIFLARVAHRGCAVVLASAGGCSGAAPQLARPATIENLRTQRLGGRTSRPAVRTAFLAGRGASGALATVLGDGWRCVPAEAAFQSVVRQVDGFWRWVGRLAEG